MTRKILLDVDPGIADALAMCLALVDPRLEVVAVTATGGNVEPEQATRNVQAIIEQIDPARWPRIGAADPLQSLRADRCDLYGDDGFCGADLNVAELHHQHPSVKMIVEEIRAAPGELTILAGGPLSNIAAALKGDPDLATQVGHLILVGGTLTGRGDVTAAAEFNMYCDAEAAQYVLHSPVTKTLLPLEVSTTAEFNIGVLDQLPQKSTGVGRVLHEILSHAFRAFRQQLGVESLCLPEALALVAVLSPELLTTESLHCEVETTGSMTLGATVFDRRQLATQQPNVDVVTAIESEAAIDSLLCTLKNV